MLTCYDVAKYILSLANEDEGDLISNLKLQKLVYYAQGLHLALTGKPIFNEQLEAWQHGPVVPELYHYYKDHGSGSIPLPTDIDFGVYNEEAKDILNEVYDVFGQFSAWKLRNMTHEEPPWKDAFAGDGIITNKAMEEYFKTQLIDG